MFLLTFKFSLLKIAHLYSMLHPGEFSSASQLIARTLFKKIALKKYTKLQSQKIRALTHLRYDIKGKWNKNSLKTSRCVNFDQDRKSKTVSENHTMISNFEKSCTQICREKIFVLLEGIKKCP